MLNFVFIFEFFYHSEAYSILLSASLNFMKQFAIFKSVDSLNLA